MAASSSRGSLIALPNAHVVSVTTPENESKKSRGKKIIEKKSTSVVLLEKENAGNTTEDSLSPHYKFAGF